MMKKILLILFLSPIVNIHGQLLINELMQSNIDCIMDDRNEFPDSWVELYNAGNVDINLHDYKIGDSEKAQEAYRLPSQTIHPHEYVLVYCDKENTGRHTHFRLESGKGGKVVLFRGDNAVDSVVGLGKQPSPNIAYGRVADADTNWGYQLFPTPGQSNRGGVSNNCLPQVIFSQLGHVCTTEEPLLLTLSMPADTPNDVQIRYTLDGSEPTANSTLYSDTIRISRTTIVRAKPFCTGWLSPRSLTQSYIYLNREMHLPIVSIVTDDRYFYDSNIGIYRDGNCNQDWRRPINLELFVEEGAQGELNQLCETRIQGGASRGLQLKSLALYANKRFGEKYFKYEFFPDQRPQLTNYKSIALRNAGNDFDYLYMRDALIQRSVAQNVDLDWQAWRPAIVFINGVYKGIENIRERGNESNIFTNYNGLENICMMENGWNLQAGNWSDWEDFKNFFSTKGHTWAEYEEVMDCNEYINWMVMNLFYNNQDFPGNNNVCWRPYEAIGQLTPRWRFLAKDTEYALGLYDIPYSYQTLEWLYNHDYDSNINWANDWEHTRMFRYAMEDSTFRKVFTDRAAIYMGDFLNYDRIWNELWEPMYNMIKDEYPIHRELYNRWWPNYSDELQKAKYWLQNRPDAFYNQLANKYQLGTPVKMEINQGIKQSIIEQLHLNINGVDITRGKWNGMYFSGQEVTLTASIAENSGKKIVGWNVAKETDGTGVLQVYSGNTCSFIMPADCGKVQVNVVLGVLSDLEETEAKHDLQAEKIILNQKVYILRDNHMFDVIGRIVR